MAVLPIFTYNDKILKKRANPVKENNRQLQELIDDMFDTMYNAEGVGLAAPQVGLGLRVFIVDADTMAEEEGEKTYGPLTFINPEIIDRSEEEIQMEEGCLSIPEVTGPVSRPKEIKITFLDRDFNERQLSFSGWLARVIQHENDHLDGILFLDHLSTFKRKLLGSKLKEIANGEKEVEYPVVPKKAVSK